MKNINKTVKIVGILILSMVFLSINAQAAYEIQNVVFDPESPVEQSSIVVTVSVLDLGENDEIYIYIKECNENSGVCDESKNLSLVKMDDTDEYKTEAGLTFNGATYLDYWFDIYYSGEWVRVPESPGTYGTVEYGEDNVNGDPNGGEPTNGDSDNGSPGFELIIMLFALIIGIYWFKRKR